MCNKIPLGYREAHELLNDIHSHHRNGQKIPKRVYFCDSCKQWHLTSESIPNEKKRRVYEGTLARNLKKTKEEYNE